MANSRDNPYRTDLVADVTFVGRERLMNEIIESVRDGRNSLHAVMGGRGMGKSSFAQQLSRLIGCDALSLVASGTVQQLTAKIDEVFKTNLTAGDPVQELANVPARHPSGSALLIIDEIEKTLGDPQGRHFLDNLRDAYERTRGRLGVLVLGGTRVRDLLLAEWSPFLRIVGLIHVLTGLERDEAAALIRAPLSLDIPDDVVDALWAETAGHPWLIQMFMEDAVRRAASLSDVFRHLPAAVRASEGKLSAIAFPMWWENIQERGQAVYRRLVAEPAAVLREDWVACFGNDPRPWLDVLASTGLAAMNGERVLARGSMFRRWMEGNYPTADARRRPGDDRLDRWLADVGVDEFEQLVVRALAAWARATVEFPAAAVRNDIGAASDNSSLQPEAFFQMHALIALLQHERDLTAEPEALSVRAQGRSDIKVRSRGDTTRRTCVEVKIFGRKDQTVVQQVIGYSAPGDTFAAVISVDRCRRPLGPVYKERCFAGAVPMGWHDPPGEVLQPCFFTVQAREGAGPLRVWHFLVQLGGA
ncbi:hypothetical protein [Nannocystis sp.]|uniref:hypothetical protein n=1 Tax=Nannocystis sp. TaxID=1962667 RepID=UPI0025CCE129|nr:hypothetical protein [Nannocystis sp.]MBK7829274.1 ATP-binding protein [Nannocystis sp.]